MVSSLCPEDAGTLLRAAFQQEETFPVAPAHLPPISSPRAVPITRRAAWGMEHSISVERGQRVQDRSQLLRLL